MTLGVETITDAIIGTVRRGTLLSFAAAARFAADILALVELPWTEGTKIGYFLLNL